MVEWLCGAADWCGAHAEVRMEKVSRLAIPSTVMCYEDDADINAVGKW